MIDNDRRITGTVKTPHFCYGFTGGPLKKKPGLHQVVENVHKTMIYSI